VRTLREPARSYLTTTKDLTPGDESFESGISQLAIPCAGAILGRRQSVVVVHREFYSWTNKTTNLTTSAVQSYPFADTMPAADPEKHLDVEVFPSNCTAVQTWQYAETLFSNVYIWQ
jgi:hypothetical protein